MENEPRLILSGSDAPKPKAMPSPDMPLTKKIETVHDQIAGIVQQAKWKGQNINLDASATVLCLQLMRDLSVKLDLCMAMIGELQAAAKGTKNGTNGHG